MGFGSVRHVSLPVTDRLQRRDVSSSAVSPQQSLHQASDSAAVSGENQKYGEPDRTLTTNVFRSDFKGSARDTQGENGPLQVNGLESETGHAEPAFGAEYERNLRRQAKGHALIQAILDCDRDDRLPFLEAILEGLRAGMPIATFGTIMAEANFWSEQASRAELKAYCAASFARLSQADQAAFLSFAERRAAA